MLAQLREYCGKQPEWKITTEYGDRESGGTSKRPEFQRMFTDASHRKFDMLLFWSLDRLSREGVLETLHHLQRLTASGVAWRSLSEEYLDSTGMFRDAVISILATIAKQEKVRIRERTIAGLERARRHGRVGGRPKRIVDVQKIEALRSQGLTWPAIATKLSVSIATVERRLRAEKGRTDEEPQPQANRPDTRPSNGAIQVQAG